MSIVEIIFGTISLIVIGVLGQGFVRNILLGSLGEKSEALKKEEVDIQKFIDEGKAKLDAIPTQVRSESDGEAIAELKKNIGS